jgi:PAS domain S-box-containing protein
MKKKVIISLSVFSLFFLLGGIYIVSTIEKSTSKLDNLITLHQVEILREHLLLQIKRVQSDIYLKNTRYARNIDSLVVNVKNLESAASSCFDCHHSDDMQKRLADVSNDIKSYKNAVSRLFTIRANVRRLEAEEDRAYNMGEHLLTQVNNMISIASSKLEVKTQSSLSNIKNTKIILFILVSLGPISTAVLAILLIKGITSPLNTLREATRKLKEGNLDFKIKGLKDEFKEVAISFNEMSESLNQYMHKIQESERRYRTLFESAGDAIFIVDAEGENAGKIISANRAAAEMHGYEVNEILELNVIKDLDIPEVAEKAPDRIKQILKGKWIKAEITHRKKDGTIFPIEMSAGLLQFMGHKYILAFERDISERKHMEKLILQFNQDWEDTFNAITDMITIHDMDFNIIRANKAAEKILSLPFLETTKVKCYNYYHGTDSPPEMCPSCECLKNGKPVTFEMFEPHLNKFLEIRAMPRFDKNRLIGGIIHVIRDITERRKVDEALQRAHQMNLVGEWAAGLAHEIKNSLAGIKVSVEVLVGDLNVPEEDKALMFQAVNEIKRIELLLKSLLNYAKPPRLQLLVTNVNEILDNAIGFSQMQHSFSTTTGKINILKEFDSNLSEIMADRLQLRQVFMNILLNASDAMSDGGTITVKTFYNTNTGLIEIEISDCGKGVDEMIKDKIFNPFFTTKSKGTGLGLAITKRIIEEHGGNISLQNNPSGGALFKIVFPVKKVTEKV